MFGKLKLGEVLPTLWWSTLKTQPWLLLWRFLYDFFSFNLTYWEPHQISDITFTGDLLDVSSSVTAFIIQVPPPMALIALPSESHRWQLKPLRKSTDLYKHFSPGSQQIPVECFSNTYAADPVSPFGLRLPWVPLANKMVIYTSSLVYTLPTTFITCRHP